MDGALYNMPSEFLANSATGLGTSCPACRQNSLAGKFTTLVAKKTALCKLFCLKELRLAMSCERRVMPALVLSLQKAGQSGCPARNGCGRI